jgi:hypothetical protein
LMDGTRVTHFDVERARRTCEWRIYDYSRVTLVLNLK